jgi:hypothetical protein
MWNKLVAPLLLIAALAASGCKSKKNLAPATAPTIAVEALEAQSFLTVLETNAPVWSTLQIKANGVAQMGGSNQRFRVEIRMVRDSIIWVDLSEPTLGFKVARAIIMPDSVAYYSGLLKKADAGSFSKLNQILGADLNFHMFQQVLIGAVALMPERELRVQTTTTSQQLFGQPNAQFKGFNGQQVTIALEMDAVQKRLSRQELFAGSNRISAQYQSFTKVGEQVWPNAIAIQTKGQQQVDLSLQFTDIQLNTPVRTPFNYPENYEPLRF